MQTPKQYLYDAELNELYYRHRADRLAKWDMAIRVVAAVLGAGAVATWARGLDGMAGAVWGVLSVAMGAASAAGPVLQLSERSRRFSDLAVKWTLVAGDLRVLLAASEAAAPDRSALLPLVRRSEELQAADVTPPDDRLSRALMRVVRVRHGLPA